MMPPPAYPDCLWKMEAWYAGATAAQHGKPRQVPPGVAPKQREAWLEGHDAWWTANPEGEHA